VWNYDRLKSVGAVALPLAEDGIGCGGWRRTSKIACGNFKHCRQESLSHKSYANNIGEVKVFHRDLTMVSYPLGVAVFTVEFLLDFPFLHSVGVRVGTLGVPTGSLF
jgi:hypothetical protein